MCIVKSLKDKKKDKKKGKLDGEETGEVDDCSSWPLSLI